MNVKFSIITVTYNSEIFLEKTIVSVLNQSYKNYEYIIIDGKSKDKTIEIAEKHSSGFEGKMFIYSEPDNGIYDAMNKGIKRSTGDLILLINSDDWLERNALEKYVKAYENINENNVILVGDTNRVNECGKFLYLRKNNFEFLKKNINYTMPLTHPSMCVHKEIYKSIIGMFNTEYKILADYDLTYHCFYSKKVDFIFTNSVTVSMRSGGISDTFNLRMIFLRSKERFIIRKFKMGFSKNLCLSIKFFIEETIRQFIINYFPNSRLLKTNH